MGLEYRERVVWYEGKRRHSARRVNELIFSSFEKEMALPRFVGADKQSAMARQAVKGYTARVANRTSKTQSMPPVDGARFGGAKLDITIAAIIKAFTFFMDCLAQTNPVSLSVPRAVARQRPCWLWECKR
jgi:hypothetical protein